MDYARGRLNLLQYLLPVIQSATVSLNDGMAVQPDNLVEQFGAEAVHHAHHHYQQRDTGHHHAHANSRDKRDHPLTAPGEHIALGNSPFEGGEDQEAGSVGLFMLAAV